MSKTAFAGSTARHRNSFVRPPTTEDLEEALNQAAAFRAAHGDPGAASEPRPRGQERRTDRRYRLKMPVIYKAGDRVGFGSSSDVSLGGMFIETDDPRPFGERITVKFRAAGLEQPLSAPAVVRWVEPDRGMGVQFESVRPLVIWALQQELKEL